MKKVPDWLLNLFWFCAGIGATGAFWYFLSIQKYVLAAVTGIITLAMIFLVIRFHLQNARAERIKPDVMTRYACLLTKSHGHEYSDGETFQSDTSDDPWITRRRARSELMLMIGQLREDQARALLLDWLGVKSWEDRLNVAIKIVERTPALRLTEDATRQAFAEILIRTAHAGMNHQESDERSTHKPIPNEPMDQKAMHLLRSLAMAGSNERRDVLLKQWAKKTPVIRHDL